MVKFYFKALLGVVINGGQLDFKDDIYRDLQGSAHTHARTIQ